MSATPKMPPVDLRLPALRRFALAITVLNVVGHAFLGFEPSYAHPLVAVTTAYILETGLEFIDATMAKRKPAWSGGGIVKVIDFLLPGHITGMAIAMLLWSERYTLLMFAVGVGVCSKALFRAQVGKGRRHFLNPSNTGITVALLVFSPSLCSAVPPYQFTEYLTGFADWILPCIILCLGTFLNGKFTRKLPLVAGWLGGFALQALVRNAIFGRGALAPLMPMSGVAFLLFTFYMVSDPATTPTAPRRQVFFGLAVAAVYGILRVNHVLFGIFYALTIVCAARGLWLLWAGRKIPTGIKPASVAPSP